MNPTSRLAALRRMAACATLAALLAPAPAARAQEDLSAPIEALDGALITAARNGKQAFADRYNALAPVVERALDLPAILQTSVGPHWTDLPAEQQQQLLSVFRTFTVASYVANFNKFNGEQINLLPGTRAVGQERVVETEIVPAGGKPIRIDYVMRQGDDGWRAVDVLLEGSISRVAVQRSDFRALLGAGGNADPLIASLQKKVADLSGGAMKP
ncbi:MAG: ABC transporter substrate-binding protein [Janthinobacterium lividum]